MTNPSQALILKNLAHQWQLDEAQLARLMSLPAEAVPQLLLIRDILTQIFTHNPELAALWPTTPNRGLHNRSPIELILDEGKEGLSEVVQFLDLQR